MKSIVLTGIQKMEICEVSKPQVKNKTEVLLKLCTVGVCGSDIHYYTTGKIGNQVVQYPFTIGHECAAIVEEVGSQVSRVKPGDRVAIDPAVSCQKCDQCLNGRPHTCRNLKFLGCPGQIEGCLSEYIVMPEQCCYKIPDSMTFTQSALIEPLSIGIYAVKLLNKPDATTIGILGSGPIGLSVYLAAREIGIKTIYMTDKIDERLVVARKAGVNWIGNPDKSDIVEDIRSKEPYLLDAVFECCGDQEALDQAIELLKPGGKLLIIGIPEVDRVSFNIHRLRRKEISIQNVRRQNKCIQTAINLIHEGRIKPDFMVTHNFKFEEIEKAFKLVESYKDGVIKAMIRFD